MVYQHCFLASLEPHNALQILLLKPTPSWGCCRIVLGPSTSFWPFPSLEKDNRNLASSWHFSPILQSVDLTTPLPPQSPMLHTRYHMIQTLCQIYTAHTCHSSIFDTFLIVATLINDIHRSKWAPHDDVMLWTRFTIWCPHEACGVGTSTSVVSHVNLTTVGREG